MIRTIITAHITADSLRELTLQINDRSLGKLALQRQQHYVMTGNRRVQMVSGLLTDSRRPNAVAEDKHQLRLWESCFRELQTRGLAAFPDVVRRDDLRADFLTLIDENRFICYTAERFGVYLHRAGRLYRVQPMVCPASAPRFYGLDFYAFDVAAEDNILILNPGFVDLFEASELEETMSSMRQISAVMTWLTDLAQTYGDGQIKPWIGFQVGRISADQVTAGSQEKRAAKRGRFPAGFPASKVTRLSGGNVLIPVPREDGSERFAEATPRTRRHLVEKTDERPSLRTDRNHPSGSRTMAEFESRATRLERLKTQDLSDVKGGLSKVVRRLSNLFPGQKGLSLLAFIAIILISLVVLLFLGKTLLGSRGARQSESLPAVVTVPGASEGDPVTLRTDFEIEWEVKANTLAVYSEPASGKMLAQLMRGDKIWKLSEPANGWVLVRLLDDRVGYVDENILKE